MTEQRPAIYHKGTKITKFKNEKEKGRKREMGKKSIFIFYSPLFSISPSLLNLFSFYLFCVLCVFVVSLFSGCREAERHTVAGIGDPAPEFVLTDLTGKKVGLKDYRGKKVILNFWATWCPPCVKEMPLLQEVHASHSSPLFKRGERGDFVVIGINYNEDHERVKKFVSGHEIKFTILIDTDLKVSMDYGIIGLPVTFFIDENGRVKDKVKGELSKDIIEEKLVLKKFS